MLAVVVAMSIVTYWVVVVVAFVASARAFAFVWANAIALAFVCCVVVVAVIAVVAVADVAAAVASSERTYPFVVYSDFVSDTAAMGAIDATSKRVGPGERPPADARTGWDSETTRATGTERTVVVVVAASAVVDTFVVVSVVLASAVVVVGASIDSVVATVVWPFDSATCARPTRLQAKESVAVRGLCAVVVLCSMWAFVVVVRR